MHIHTFTHAKRGTYLNSERVQEILQEISANTDVNDLAVAVYFGVPGLSCRGTAYIRDWHTPQTWHAQRGTWKNANIFPVPQNLPERFRLIRMHLDRPATIYPRAEQDIYGWKFHYTSLEDHLALLFAHELHHYRRYHLNLHPRQGEQAANKWALSRTQDTGFSIAGKRILLKKKRKQKRRISIFDPFKKFRGLKKGDKLLILNDTQHNYQGETALVERPIRLNSKRIVIMTPDGKIWRWPMSWLKPV
ncbi:hypothetical protein KAR48_13510 [bacterium]|nr:hypothetical protein [bacterium]